MDDAFAWGGWVLRRRDASESREHDQVALHIGPLPGRKQICLYGHNERPGVISVYAFFPTEEKAREAKLILDRIVKPNSD